MAHPGMASIVSQWQGRFDGRLLTPSDAAYEGSRRVWNAMIDRRPALIARCVNAADVRAAVKLARAEQIPVSVRGGGHSVAGTAVCEGGLMIDLSLMKDVGVDPASREATAAPGALWSEFDRATQDRFRTRASRD